MKLTLKGARANANLTQGQAGEMLGVSKNTIRAWERGRSFPDVAQLKVIEKIYNVGYNDLVFPTDSSVKANKQSRAARNNEKGEMK